MAEGRKRRISGLQDRLADPDISDGSFAVILSERARLIQEEADELGIPTDDRED